MDFWRAHLKSEIKRKKSQMRDGDLSLPMRFMLFSLCVHLTVGSLPGDLICIELRSFNM